MGKSADGHEKPEAAGKGTDSPRSGGGRGARKDETIRVLEGMNRQLHARVRELELKRIGGGEELEGEAAGHEGDQDAKRFSSVINSLGSDIDAALVLKKALEADLNSTRKKLSEEETAREQFEARAGLLEGKAALADQLREDISFIEEEQNRTFRRLGEVTSELERVAKERDKLAEAKKVRDTRINELMKQRFDLEADVLELKARLEEMVSFFSEKQKSSSP